MSEQRKNGAQIAHGSNGATFEQQFRRLQEVVQTLSDGNLTLQEALSAFEEGMALADSCGQMLEEAELRVQQVSERASRAGQSAALDLNSAIRPLPVGGEGETLTFEVESYEATLVFEVPEAQQASGAKDAAPDIKQAPKKPGPRPISNDPSSFLDPLFDEDD
jgi:exodeoxyribonuclease VII small subunit